MRSTFMGIEIAKRSLFSQQAALTTTGHNIANANTRGYTRQVVNLVAAKPMEPYSWQRSTLPGQVGQGVEYDSIKRIREGFLDHQYYHENKYLGEWSIRRDALEKIESIVNEPTDGGIRQVIENFWNSWQDLSKEPDNLTARAVVKERALALTDAMNHTSKQLNDLAYDLTQNIEVKVQQANTYLEQIASLNVEIYRLEGLGNNANDLRDQRDVLMDDLSKIMNITRVETESGYQVSMGGVELVNAGTVVTPLSSSEFESAYSLDKSGDLSSGEVFGMIYARDELVANYQLQFNTIMQTMAEGEVSVTLPAGMVIPEGAVIGDQTYNGSIEDRTVPAGGLQVTVNGINGIHRLGYLLQTGSVQTGDDFFTIKSGFSELTAESVQVNADIIDDVKNIASSTRVYDDNGELKVVQGNGDLALLIAEIRNMRVNFDPDNSSEPILTDGTFDEFFRAVVGQLGVESEEAARQSDNQKVLADQVDIRRQSVSGVSLDEEMSNMIKFQHAYNAAARVMTTFDEMLDKVINGMGTVGR